MSGAYKAQKSRFYSTLTRELCESCEFPGWPWPF